MRVMRAREHGRTLSTVTENDVVLVVLGIKAVVASVMSVMCVWYGARRMPAASVDDENRRTARRNVEPRRPVSQAENVDRMTPFERRPSAEWLPFDGWN
jgi:hypothetical protein